MNVTLYKFAANPIIVDKTNYLMSPLSITGEVPEATQDMERPTLYFAFSSEPEYNYAYVQEYHRYYYIKRKTWVSGNVWEFELEVDELYTYRALVGSLAGVFNYSTMGTGRKYDSRLAYKDQPSIARSIGAQYPDFILDNSTSNPYNGAPMVMFRYYDIPQTIVIPDIENHPVGSVNVAFMRWRSYEQFCRSWLQLGTDEAQRLSWGSAIIDVTPIYYINETRLSVSAYSGDNNFTIHTPGYPSGIAPSMNFSPTTAAGGLYRIISPSTQEPLMGYSVVPGPVISDSNYWTLHGKYTTKIPYIGNVSITPSSLGITYATSIFYAVALDAFSKEYVITPMTAADGSGTWFYDATLHIPIPYTTPFPIDSVYDHTDTKVIASTLGVVTSLIAASVAPEAVLPLAVSKAVSSGIQSPLNIRDYINEAKIHYDFIGESYGCSEWTPSDIDKIIQTSEIIEPATDPTLFASRFGRPDGQFRTITGYQGYLEMGDFRMVYDPNATIDEMTRLEAQLKQGVII